MKVDGSDWKGNEFPKDKSPEEIQSEVIFDRLLFYRRLANISAERLRIINELERLLTEDQDKFVEYLSNNIQLYEAECEFSLDDVDGLHNKDDATYFDEEGNIKDIHFDKEGNIVDINDFHYDKNTTVVQYNQIIKEFILEYLQEIKKLSDKEQIEEIT
ncbi:MAG: hypothetical protein FWC03_07600, partial [Treponema sp.]|nr:hypothetical protein [Treponema sp.]